MDEVRSTLEQLVERVETLERRVDLLEHLSAVPSPPPAEELAATPAAATGQEPSLAQAGGAFSVLGKAMLGIAGAYLLRAVAESGLLPKPAIAAVAIVYAFLWLSAAARVQAGAWFASIIYSSASALILAPMLWELTLDFKVLPGLAAAAILGAFVVAATALAWKRNLAPVFWVANGIAAGEALALSAATHQLEPFIAALLLMALVCEYAAERNHELSVRPLVGAAADGEIGALILIYSSPQSAHMDYPAIGMAGSLLPGCLLFLLYAASVTIRTARLGQRMTLFETGQTMIAFLLAALSVVHFEPGWGSLALGLVCLLLSAACYVAAFVLFGNSTERRNCHVFALWAAGLLVAGSLLLLPSFWLAACLGLAAIAATVLGARLNRLMLEFHGLVFLAVAAAASGLPGYVFHALAGTLPARLDVSVCMVSACALVCCTAGRHGPQENWKRQFLHLATLALAVCAFAALLLAGLLRMIALEMPPEGYHIALIRTLILCALALALVFVGSRWRRVELTRMAYAIVVFVAAKLLFEDMRFGHLGFIAASIFLFALTLIAVPRLVRLGRKA
jgi:hypothetical protein